MLTAGQGGLDGPTASILTSDARIRDLTLHEAPHGARKAGTVRIPTSFNPRDARSRRDLASSLRNALSAGAGAQRESAERSRPDADERELTAARRELRAHPCHSCPDLPDHLRWASRLTQLEREQRKLDDRIAGRTSSIARDFDKICEVLLTLGYLQDDGEDRAEVTEAGQTLQRLYSERDLVLAEVLRSGTWSSLAPAELACAVTSIVYSARRDEDAAPHVLTRGLPNRLAQALEETVKVSNLVTDLEERVGLSASATVDLGLARTMYDWAKGASLSDVLIAGELGAGDLVRWCRQVLDILDQVASAAPSPATRRAAREAMDLVRRGVVGQELS